MGDPCKFNDYSKKKKKDLFNHKTKQACLATKPHKRSWRRASKQSTSGGMRLSSCSVVRGIRTCSLHTEKTVICGPRNKKIPLSNLEEELIMEAWCLLKNDKEVPHPTPFLLIMKLQPTKFLGAAPSCPPTGKPHKHLMLVNYFLSITLPLTNSYCVEV